MPINNASMTTLDNAPNPDKKYFTVEEANRALPYVSRIVDDVTTTYSQLIDLRQQLETADEDSDVRDLEISYEQTMDRLGSLVDELHAVGTELKDFEKGLIDFPAVHEGREVLLCWRQGEKRVAHWHEVDAGFAGRQPVKPLLGQ